VTGESTAAQARSADLAKVRQARAMTEEQRILSGPRLFAGVCDRIREGLVDENPNASPEALHQLLLHRLSIVLKPRHRAVP
jgi:hypothetical protein